MHFALSHFCPLHDPLQGKQSKSVMLQNGRRLSALDVAQNELLVTVKGMPSQGQMMCVLNTEGKCGTVADAEVQLVKPGMYVCMIALVRNCRLSIIIYILWKRYIYYILHI